jgi:hypothetical protein
MKEENGTKRERVPRGIEAKTAEVKALEKRFAEFKANLADIEQNLSGQSARIMCLSLTLFLEGPKTLKSGKAGETGYRQFRRRETTLENSSCSRRRTIMALLRKTELMNPPYRIIKIKFWNRNASTVYQRSMCSLQVREYRYFFCCYVIVPIETNLACEIDAPEGRCLCYQLSLFCSLLGLF